MPGPSRSSGSSQRGWRGAAGGKRQPSKSAKRTARIIMLLVMLGLIGLFAWLVIPPFFNPDVHLVHLPVVNYGALAVPSVPYASEDEAAFAAASPYGEEKSLVLRDSQTSDGMAKLTGRLEGEIARSLGLGAFESLRKDILIFSLSGQAISEDGTAYILCSDFLRQGAPGRFPLSDLLQQVHECEAAVKLLVLNVGHLPSDPRLGMVVNEFPQLLDKEVAAVDDPALWVLTANAPFELSQVSHSMKRSIFNYFLVEGLQGKADEDEDGAVELDELYRFVNVGVSEWVKRETARRDSQTPMLLHGGQGIAEPPSDLVLLQVTNREPDEASEDGEAAAGEGTQGNSDSDARKRLRGLLQKGWELRDRMLRRDDFDDPDLGTWTAVDYAPHLWREYEELLLSFELRFRAGAAFDPGELADNLETEILPLEDLLQGRPVQAGLGASTVLERLEDARTEFLEQKREAERAAAGSVEDEAAQAQRDLEAAVQLKNDLLSRVPYYLRWHAAASRTASKQLTAFEKIYSLVSRSLPNLIGPLEDYERQTTDSTSVSTMRPNWKDLTDETRELRQRKQELEAGLDQEAADLVAQVGGNPKQKGLAGRLETFLSTPLLSASRRIEVIAALEMLDQPPPGEDDASGNASIRTPAAATWHWDRAQEQARLEVQAVRLADPNSPIKIGTNLSDPWESYRRLGTQLGQFYEGLPGRIDKAVGDRFASVDRALAERLLRAVDARDAWRVDERFTPVAVHFPKPPPAPEGIRIEGPGTLALTRDGWKPLELQLRALGTQRNRVSIWLVYKPNQVEVEALDEGLLSELGEKARITMDPNQQRTLRWQVRPKPGVEFDETSVQVSAAIDQQTEMHEVVCRLPKPDVVELLVERIGAVSDVPVDSYSTGDADVFELRPYPNRMTGYKLAVRNLFNERKKLTVQLMAVPRAERGRRGNPLDALGTPRRGYRPLGEPIPLELAPSEAKRIPFPAPPAPKSAASPEPKPEEPPQPDDRPELTSGLVCVVSDVDSQDKKRWIKWLDFAPRRPYEYLTPEVGYDDRLGQILIKIRARTPEGLPPLSKEEPIEIVWDTEVSKALLGSGIPMKGEAKLARPDDAAELYAEIATSQVVTVHLTVDGYPRAFIYRLKCDERLEDVPRIRDPRDVRITRPEPGQSFKAPRESIPVKLEVDAPEDAFASWESQDVVKVWIESQRGRRYGEELFDGNRSVDIRLEDLSSAGVMTVESKVGDFDIELRPSGLINEEVDLVAQLLLTRRNPEVERIPEARVPVKLDGAPPEIEEFRLASARIPKGGEVGLSVKVTDLSGIGELKAGFDLNEDGDFKNDPNEKPEAMAKPGADGVSTIRLPTEGMPPGDYLVRVVAVDVVDNDAATAQRAVTILEAPMTKKPDGKPEPVNSRIEGWLLSDGRRQGFSWFGRKVWIEETGAQAQTTGDGKFTFKDVPPGTYTIKAEASLKNILRRGSAKITVPQDTQPATVNIGMQ